MIEAVRHRRLLLSAMAESPDAIGDIRQELSECGYCLTRRARSLLVINAGMVIAPVRSDKDAVIRAAQQALPTISTNMPGANLTESRTGRAIGPTISSSSA